MKKLSVCLVLVGFAVLALPGCTEALERDVARLKQWTHDEDLLKRAADDHAMGFQQWQMNDLRCETRHGQPYSSSSVVVQSPPPPPPQPMVCHPRATLKVVPRPASRPAKLVAEKEMRIHFKVAIEE